MQLLCLSRLLPLSKPPCSLHFWRVTRSACRISGREFKPKACLESEGSLGRYPKARVSAEVRGAMLWCPSPLSLREVQGAQLVMLESRSSIRWDPDLLRNVTLNTRLSLKPASWESHALAGDAMWGMAKDPDPSAIL